MTKNPSASGTAAPRSPANAAEDAKSGHEVKVIPVLAEELHVSKRRVEMDSGVRISKTIDEREEMVDVPLVKEEIEVERIAVNRPVDALLDVRHEGDTTIYPIVEEVLFVEKRLMLKEEIRVTRRRTQVRDPQRVTLRTEHAAVERIESTRSEDALRNPHFASSNDVPRSRRTDSEDSLLEQKRRQDEVLRREVSHRPALK